MSEEIVVGTEVVLNQEYARRNKGAKGVVRRVTRSDITTREDLIEVHMNEANDRGNFTVECYRFRLDKVKPVAPIYIAPSFGLGTLPVPPAPLPDAIYLVAQSADRIFPRRSYDTILKSLMEEMGELSTEIAIKQGTKQRDASVDGVRGEAVDVFIVAVDMLRAAWGDDLFTHKFSDKVKAKLNKWEGK